jgi:hypothetical protein
VEVVSAFRLEAVAPGKWGSGRRWSVDLDRASRNRVFRALGSQGTAASRGTAVPWKPRRHKEATRRAEDGVSAWTRCGEEGDSVWLGGGLRRLRWGEDIAMMRRRRDLQFFWVAIKDRQTE